MARSSSITTIAAALAPLLVIPTVRANSFGNYWDVTAPPTPNFIRQANTTLVLPSPPNPVVWEMSLWPGEGMSNGDLVQSLAISYKGDNVDAGCGTLGSDWCLVGSTLDSGADGQSESPNHGIGTAGDHVTFAYLLNPTTTETDQYVYLNGDLVSTFSSSAGAIAQGWGTAEECQPGTPCGTIPQHSYINSVWLLDTADPNFGSTVGMSGASGEIYTNDGGLTWHVDEIVIDAYDFTTGQ